MVLKLAGFFASLVPGLWIFLYVYWPEISEDIEEKFAANKLSKTI